jgi:hypothetical protein
MGAHLVFTRRPHDLFDQLYDMDSNKAAVVSSLDVLRLLCCAQVMNDEGETQQVQLAVCDQELVEALRKAFQAEQEVLVQLGTRHGKTAITKMTVQ